MTVYHEPPPTDYIRPSTYRLEVDYEKDLQLVREVAAHVGMEATLPDVIRLLDRHPEIVAINTNCAEKTGPLVSFTHAERRSWFHQMKGQPVIDWNNLVWKPPSSEARPVFCSAGNCLLGYGDGGRLYSLDGHVFGGPDIVSCECTPTGGRVWHPPLEKHSRA